ncbi:MAG: metallophosphatase family protein [Corallococcus sp.]|nr:metallophosphatase family protein [Corallococcus sp.]
MGRIGVISDIHGNLEALIAILKYFDELKCDEIIHTGDVVDIGPSSRECLELLLSRRDATLLLGNHDRDFALNESTARKFSHVPTEHKRQVFSSMNDALRKQVAAFPLKTTRVCGGDRILFAHYALNEGPFDMSVFPFKPLVQRPSAEIFDEMFDGVDAKAVFFGHKHEPCDIRGRILYVDVGSVGCYPEPFARGIVIDYDELRWSYRRVAVPYDMEKTRRQMRQIAAGEDLYDFYFLHAKRK